MKTMSYVMSAMLTLLGVGLFAAPTVSADCENYGNQVNVGSEYECTSNYTYCDGDAGPAGSGAGAGAGAGAGGESGAEAGASAGTSTNCQQCSGDNCSAGNQTEPDGPRFKDWLVPGYQFDPCKTDVTIKVWASDVLTKNMASSSYVGGLDCNSRLVLPTAY